LSESDAQKAPAAGPWTRDDGVHATVASRPAAPKMQKCLRGHPIFVGIAEIGIVRHALAAFGIIAVAGARARPQSPALADALAGPNVGFGADILMVNAGHQIADEGIGFGLAKRRTEIWKILGQIHHTGATGTGGH